MHEIDKTKLTDQTKLRLYEIKNIEDYFINEINERKSYGKKLNKYGTIFDYMDKILIILSATSSGISTGIIKKLLNMTRNKKKKHDKNLDISHKEFKMISNENDKYEKMKYNLIS